MNKKEVNASQAGTVNLGNELSVHRLGYGAMRLTGPGIWGPPKDRKAALAVLRRAVELGVNFIDKRSARGSQVRIRYGGTADRAVSQSLPWARRCLCPSLGERRRTIWIYAKGRSRLEIIFTC